MPYRAPPRSTDLEQDPVLDRVPIWLGRTSWRLAYVGVTARGLRFEPRLGRPRSVPLALDALKRQLPLAHSLARPRRNSLAQTVSEPCGEDTLASWIEILASDLFREPLAATRNDAAFVSGATWHDWTHDKPARGRGHFVATFTGDRLVCLHDGAETFTACLGTEGTWPDSRAGLLGRALAWLPAARRALAIQRLLDWDPQAHATRMQRPVTQAAVCRSFTREQVRARVVAGKLHHVGGSLRRDGDEEIHTGAFTLCPSAAEVAALEAWLQSDR